VGVLVGGVIAGVVIKRCVAHGQLFFDHSHWLTTD
jgi:hypothetical protein